jgi:hypothetical protein
MLFDYDVNYKQICLMMIIFLHYYGAVHKFTTLSYHLEIFHSAYLTYENCLLNLFSWRQFPESQQSHTQKNHDEFNSYAPKQMLKYLP